MIRNKALWERVLVVFSVFSFCMSMLGSLPESLRYGYKLDAAAAETVTRLTPEQTLALYGRSFNGTWYNKNTGLSYTLTFKFQFTSDRWRPNDYTDTPTFISSVASQIDNASRLNDLRSTPFLIYTADISYDNNTVPWVSSASASHANVNLNFSVNFSHVSLWDQVFMWGLDYPNAYWYNYAYIDTYLDGLSPYRVYAARRQTSQTSMAYSIFPWYPAVSQSNIVESKLMYAGWFHPTIGLDGNYYTMTGQDLVLQNVKDYQVDGSSLLTGVSVNGSSFLFLFIGCPQISGFNPFPETTPASTAVTAGTTVSYQTYPTVDLSGLESGVGTMVQMQDENNYYERIQIDQLNMIIAQLNAIYQAMVERGEVPVSLTDADSYPTLNNTVLSGVNDAITTYTMAQLPADQIGNGATGLTSFMFFLSSGPWMAIGLFFIGFAIFSWFIFRGRGI